MRDEERRFQMEAKCKLIEVDHFISGTPVPPKIIMPRGQRSKLRSRGKRRNIPGENMNPLDDKVATIEKEEYPSSASPPIENQPECVSTDDIPSSPEVSEEAAAVTDTASASSNDAEEEAQSQEDVTPDLSRITDSWRKDPLNRMVVLLVQFLIDKYQNKETILRSEMLKLVIKKHKPQFNEILKRASEHMELAFGVDLKEVDSVRHCYTLVNKLDHSIDGPVSEEDNIPKTGLLMVVLGLIFMNENYAPEEEVWEVLNLMGVYANRRHFIYGNPKKVITQDLVELQYLKYQLVPNSDPPRYEFTWGPRSQAEVSKMKILEYLAKIHDSSPSAFPYWYEEALKDEEERAQARIATRARNAAAMARADSTPSHAK
ncbi:melanoma-associated antigen B18-like [Perognathus longimembris pacificus]|uniref:melanoma-associated antigen B18-like n=1 Tax=Perognathus longimembris pacificus TaxID=214514 RepID=UPI00201982D2|nr:melanoma-associated antigen B18-like [Perognathus longimembris pacificus]